MRFNIFLLLFVIPASVLLSCGGSKKSKSKNIMPGTWQATPISIDGDSKDWPSPYPNYDSKAKLGYATSNDRKFLYITVETGDDITEMKILKAGMDVLIDTSGGKDGEFTISYPLQNENSEIEIPHHDKKSNGGKEEAMHMEKTLSKGIRKGAEGANQFTLAGFANCDGGHMVSQSLPCGIMVKTRIDEYNELVWEAAIPVKALYNKDSLTAAESEKPISVCFHIKGLKAPKSQGSDNASSSMSQPGGSSSMGGRGGGRNMGGAPKTRQAENPLANLYVSSKTWKQFRLVVQP